MHDALDELCGLLGVVIHGAHGEDVAVRVLPGTRHRHHWVGRVESHEIVTQLVGFEGGAVSVLKDVKGDEAPTH